jgi:hypothetical protein
MPAGTEDPLDRVREEHLKRIFDLYEARSRSFRTVFSGLIGFSFLFLFLVLFPYVSIQNESHRIAERLKGLPEEIAPGEGANGGVPKGAGRRPAAEGRDPARSPGSA